jgi:tyrosinase
MTHGMPPVKGLDNLREPVAEGYYPKLLRGANNRTYPGRPENTVLRDLNRDGGRTVVKIADLEMWRDRILNAINQGYVSVRGEMVPLNNEQGIDILGNLIEETDLSLDKDFYGSLHNTGHNLISFCIDPTGK